MSAVANAAQPHAVQRIEDKEWTGETGLLSIVVDAVIAVDWPRKGQPFSIRSDESYPSEMLMTVLTYCYATGIYGSEEVVTTLHTNRKVRELFATEIPDWKTVRRFRRLNREGLHKCIRYVVSQALLIRFGDSDEDPTPVDYFVALAFDRWFEPLCVPCPASEADDRIQRAIILDELLVD